MLRGFLSREIDGRAWLRALAGHGPAILLGLGAVLRVAEYLRGRGYWLDEGSLAANIVGHPAWQGPRPLKSVQLAPFGFLVVERALAGLLGGSPYVLRLVPLAAGLAALPLFAILARRCLRPRALPVALGLFALSDSLIYFASELKPYSVDVAAALMAWILALGLRRGRRSPARLAGLALLGAALVWFSFPVAFVLAGVGSFWIAEALLRRRYAQAALNVTVCATWLASFAASLAVARQLLGDHGQMWAFWDFAFPPRSLAAPGWLWMARRLINLFANPLHFDTPLGAGGSAVLGAVLAALGAVAMARRRPGWCTRLGLPLLLVLLAAIAQVYPFHGRLVLFLLPALYLWMAEGIGLLGDASGGGLAYRILLVAVFLWPVLEAVLRILAPPLREFSSFGDLRPNPFL